MIDYADKMLLTEIDAECHDADVYFPDFDTSKWEKEVLSTHITEDNIIYKHLVYRRK